MLKTIAFEPDDSISRVDQSTIGLVSRTGPHVDGIHVRLVLPPIPPEDSASFDDGAALELTTGPYSRTFTIDELVALNLIEPVDRAGTPYRSRASRSFRCARTASSSAGGSFCRPTASRRRIRTAPCTATSGASGSARAAGSPATCAASSE